MAGFQVSINGRFWVSTEGPAGRRAPSRWRRRTTFRLKTGHSRCYSGIVVSPQLRAAEGEIDRVPLSNVLVRQPFSRAAWRFMAANEERVMREIVNSDRTGTSRHDQDYAALFDSIVVSTKWPMRWLLGNCRSGDTIPQAFDVGGYEAAHELSTLGQNYSHFEAAFTYASLGILTLALDDRWIRASDEFRRDTRYDAYDRLRQPRMTDTPLDGVDEVISALGTTRWFQGPVVLLRYGAETDCDGARTAVTVDRLPFSPPGRMGVRPLFAE